MITSLNPEHLAYLEAHAVSKETAERFGVRSINYPKELTNGLGHCGAYVTGILFPWRTVDGREVSQYRPDDPPLDEDGHPKKYLFPKGSGSVIGVILGPASGR